MPERWKHSFIAFAMSLMSVAQLAAQQKDLTYNTVTPCFIVNTFAAGGAFAANETRTYNVVGNGSFAGQGGSATGCGIPGFSNGIARVQAVALNVAVFNSTGAGNLWVIPADGVLNPFIPWFLNFNYTATFANTGPMAVAQTSGIGDIKINVGISGAHVVASVVGYYTRFGETILVGPGATPAAGGTALLNALTSIADNSASKPYLIKLEPGIYDLGDNRLQMKPFVDIEGSGRNVTIVQGAGNPDASNFTTGVIRGASSAELRNLTLKAVGSVSRPWVIPMYNNLVSPTIRDVAILSSGGTNHWGIRNLGASPTVEGVSITVTASGNATYGISDNGTFNSKIRRTEISVTNSGSGETVGVFADCLCSPGDIRDSRIDVSGTSVTYGVRQAGSFPPGLLTIEGSTITARNASITYGVRLEQGDLVVTQSKVRALGSGGRGIVMNGSATVNHSEVAGELETVSAFSAQVGATLLEGGPASAALTTCAGVYDETYTFFANTCP